MSHSMDMKSAWAQMKSSAVSNWTDVRPRLFDACQPEVPTSFTVPADSTVFTIGSCFARNIEENLARLGYRLPMLDFDVPDSEKRNSRAAGLLNKYTPPAVWQELDWCARILRRDGVVSDADCADLYYEMDGLCHDAVMHDRFPLTKERMIARRQHAFDVLRHVFTADCVVITLGFTECFYDTSRDLYVINSIVRNEALRESLNDQIEFQSLTFAQSHSFIRRSLDLIWEMNPEARVLLTVSPVPLQATFTGLDVILATSQTKSQLRAVVAEIIGTDPRVGYFPSYEQVMLSRTWNVFSPDLRHVSDHMVKSVVSSLTQTYFEADSTLQARFNDGLEAARKAENAFNALVESAQSQIELGQPEAAKAQAEEALDLAQRHDGITNGALKAWRVLDRVAVEMQDWTARDTALMQMAALRPGACMVWIKLAYNNLRLSRPDAARAALERARETAPPGHPTAHSQIEKLTARLSETDQ